MQYKSITLRIPQPLHKTLLDIAYKKSKSLNAEIINRLQNSLTIDHEQVSLDSIRHILREELLNKENLNPLKNNLLINANQMVTRDEVEAIAHSIITQELKNLGMKLEK